MIKEINKFIEIPVIIVEIALSIGIGFGLNVFISTLDPFIVGIITFLIIELARIKIYFRKSIRYLDIFKSLLESKKNNPMVRELSLLYGLKDIYSLQSNSVFASKDDVWKFWRDCITRADQSFQIISYGSAKVTWNLPGWDRFSMAIQEERVKNKCRIQRIFCLDSEKEKIDLDEEMQNQKDIGVDVYYVYKKEILKNQILKSQLRVINTYDFAIIDNSWIMRGHLNKDRSFNSISASSDEVLLEKSRFIFTEVLAISEKLI